MPRAKTRIRYALAVIDDINRARHPQPGTDGLRFVTHDSLRSRKVDVRAGVDYHRLTIGLSGDLADTRLYASEESAWLDNIGLKLQQSGISVVKIRIANATSSEVPRS